MTIGYIVERHGPRFLALASAIAYVVWADGFFFLAEAKKWDVAALYGAVFDMSSLILPMKAY
jgi:hypothetical protein